MAGHDPVTGSDLGRRFGEGSVRGFDATFSAPKSVSVLFGVGEPELRLEITDAHDRAVETVLGWIEAHAHTRLRRRGHIVCVDTEGLVVGVFRQHTSRRLDPQLHTHAVIANRVRAPDGRWLALDARTIKLDQRTLSALYHAALRTELTRRLGVRGQQPENGIAEIIDLEPTVLAEFSQRTGDLQRRLDVKLARFRTGFGRDPTSQELWKLEREAAVDSRPVKNHGHPAGEMHSTWRGRLRGLGHDPKRVIETAVGREHRRLGIDAQMAETMVGQALESLGDRQSTWRPAELVRELAATVPTVVCVDSELLVGFIGQLADHVVANRCVDISRPASLGAERRRDRRPVTEAAVDRVLTTQAVLDQEERLVAWAQSRCLLSDTLPIPPASVAVDDALAPAQVEVAAAVAGAAQLELVVGPAGAGKTTALTPAVAHLQAEGRSVFGVTPTAAAAAVLATETAMTADTLDKLLTEHRHPDRTPHPLYDLAPGTTIVVDEAGTASTPKLAALAQLADQRRWRVVLVGDPRQFSAVGRGGMFAHLVDIHGAIELDQVHRFRHQWERSASLRLRNGDPAVLTEYERHGRIHGGTQQQMESEILDAWTTARQRSAKVALMANSTTTVTRLNHLAQQRLIEASQLDPTGPCLRRANDRIMVDDEVVTRRNDRTLRTDRRLMIKNRDYWTVTEIHPDGSLALTGNTGTVRLPASYVSEHVELGYAQTSHATQGRTVETALLLVDTPTDSRGIYTPMTRGRDDNHAYVVTEENHTAVDLLAQSITREWIDQPAIARRNELETGRQDPPRT